MQLERNGKVIEDIKIHKNKVTLKINDEKITMAMERDEWKSGMMVEDEQILDFISEIDEAIDKAKKTFKDYRPLLNGDR